MSWELWWQIALLLGWAGFIVAFIKSVKPGDKS
jgi:hypothetical protein